MAASDRFQVYLSDEMQEWLEQRSDKRVPSSSIPARVKIELDLWRWHLAEELRSTTWTLGEIGCLADILNSTILFDKVSGGSLWVELADAFDDVPGAFARQWGIEEARLLEKVRSLGPTAEQALTEAIATWWANEDSTSDTEGWARVGIRAIENTNPAATPRGDTL